MSPQETITLGVRNESKVATLIKVGSADYDLAAPMYFSVPLQTKITIKVLSNSVLVTVAEGKLAASQEHLGPKHIDWDVDVGCPKDELTKTVTEPVDIQIKISPLGRSVSPASEGGKNSLEIREVKCGD